MTKLDSSKEIFQTWNKQVSSEKLPQLKNSSLLKKRLPDKNLFRRKPLKAVLVENLPLKI